MARKIKITITTASNLVVVQDYDSTSLEIYQMLNCGFGEFTMQQSGSIDLSEDSARIAFVHANGTRFGDAAFSDFQAIIINGATAGISDLETVRAVLAPYFFSLGGGGEFAFYTEVTLTPAILLNQFAPPPGYMFMPAVAGHYYDFKINWEYTRGTASYSTGFSSISFDMLDVVTSRQCAVISGQNLSYAGDRVCPNIRPQMISTAFNSFPIGSGLYIKLTNNTNPTLGDGTVLLKIWYNLIAPS